MRVECPRAGAEVWLSDLPVPGVTEGTTLVRVRAAALNAIDSALAARTMAQMIPHRYPLVLAVTPPGPSRR